MKTDWFELKDARLHLAPYTCPHFPIAVASVTTPAGVMVAGKHGLGLLSIGAGLPGGSEKLAEQWAMGETEAAKSGANFSRDGWRLVINVHVAETDERALRDVAVGERMETLSYFSETLGRPPMRSEDPLGDGLKAGSTLVGSPETVALGIERLLAHTGRAGADEHGNYGAGGVLFRANDWANREDSLRSFELFARWVMPRFQGSTITTHASREWASANRNGIFGPQMGALRKAFEDAGKEAPDHVRMRLHTGKVDL